MERAATGPRIVIVGAGFGGLRAAQGLAKAKAKVTVIDRFNHHLFQPLLYQVATAGLSPAQIASPVRSILRRQANAEVILGEVIGVDATKSEVVLKQVRGSGAAGQVRRSGAAGDHRLPYDYLILATGSHYNYFGHPEWETFAPCLKTVQDALEMRSRLLLAFERAEREGDEAVRRALLTIVIVGAGPTGVELAGAIAELARKTLSRDFRHIRPGEARIMLVEAGQRILAAFPEPLARAAHRRLEALGVEVSPNTRVQHIDESRVVLNGHTVEARTVLWAAGVVASPLAQWLGVEADRSGHVSVTPYLNLPGDDRIFVIGDAALVLGRDKRPLPGVAPVAMQEGSYVAKAIHRRLETPAGGRREGKARAPFRYRNMGNLATVGRAFALADLGFMKTKGLFAWVLWLLVHVLYLIGFRNKITVLIEWAWAFLTYERGARLITQPEEPGGISP